jgi:hypothetical protein
MITAREDLDRQMRSVLIEIATCSHVPAVTYGGGAGSDEHPGGRRPPGDLGGERLARRYGPPFHTCTINCKHRVATSDTDRERVLADARDELRLIRGRGGGVRVRSDDEEQPEDTIARMLKETAGWDPDAFASSRWHMSARMVRRHRGKAGLDPETGRALDVNGTRAEKAAAMKERGMTTRQIAAILDVSHPTIIRDLKGRNAA